MLLGEKLCIKTSGFAEVAIACGTATGDAPRSWCMNAQRAEPDDPKSTLLGCEIQAVRWSPRGSAECRIRLKLNPRYPKGYTRSPNWRIRPLSHPSGGWMIGGRGSRFKPGLARSVVSLMVLWLPHRKGVSYVAFETPTLQDAKELFRIYCTAKGLSPRTIDTYLFSIERLELFLGATGPVEIPDTHELRGFISHMLDRGLSKQTVRVRMRSIRVFFNFLQREGIVEASSMASVEIPRVPVAIPTVLTDDQMAALIKAFDKPDWHSKRNRAMLMTFLDTGVRLSELIGLDLSDIDLRQGSILIRNGKGARDLSLIHI